MNRIQMLAVCALACSAMIGCSNGVEPVGGEPGPRGPKGDRGETGPQGAPGDVAQFSGTRLRARYITGEDGSRQFVDWFDLETAQPCLYREYDVRRCVPAEMFNSRILFTDEDCTETAIRLHPADAADGLAYAQVYSEAEEQTLLVKPGEPLNPQPEAGYWTTDGECMLAPVPGGAAFSFVSYELLPPSFFVAGEVVVY